jgi:hypothetical protein
MMAMTALVRPVDSLEVIPLLEQRLRRNFTTLRVREGQLLLHVPAVGRVLVTEQLARIRLDIVAENDRVTSAVTALDEEIRSQVRYQSLSIDWSESAIIPAALR